MIHRTLTNAALVAAVSSWAVAAQAEETVVWWDFLGGGDGVRMKKLIEDFNAEHAGAVKIDATTLEWGVALLRQGADLGRGRRGARRHDLPREPHPARGQQGILDEITADDWATMGLAQADFAPATWDAVTVDGKQYAVPLDTHPIVLYYNKDLLARGGRPRRRRPARWAWTAREGFTATLQALKDAGVEFPLGSVTADGNFMFRTIYSLMCQQGGELMTDGEFLAGDNGEKLAERAGGAAGLDQRRACSRPTPTIPRPSRSSPRARRR